MKLVLLVMLLPLIVQNGCQDPEASTILLPPAPVAHIVPGPFYTIKVGPFNYKVEWMSEDFECGNKTADGCTSISSRKIQVEVESPMSTRATLLHELMHAVAANYQNPYEPQELSGEEWAQTSPLWLEVLRDNPQVIKYLTEPDRE